MLKPKLIGHREMCGYKEEKAFSKLCVMYNCVSVVPGVNARILGGII